MNTAVQGITIDEEFRSLIPPLTDSERAELEASLLFEGCRDALVVWRGLLLDGNHRLEICEKDGIPYNIVEIELPDRAAAKAWIVRNQFARRNLTPFQRCELALKLEQLLPSRQGERTHLTSDQNQSEVERPSRQAAKAAGVAYDTYRKAKVVGERAGEEVKAKLRSGGTTIHREYTQLVDAERKAAQVEAERAATMPAGKYQVIVADPPSRFDCRPDDPTRRGRTPYPPMSVEEIAALPVVELACEDSILWLWTTNARMVDAHRVAAAWDFEVKTILTWAKDQMGCGNWLRGQTEHCLLCVRGRPVVTLTNQTTLLHGKVREHSRKPQEFYEMVESLCPGSKVELFARERRDGWAAHGAELDMFQVDRPAGRVDRDATTQGGVAEIDAEAAGHGAPGWPPGPLDPRHATLRRPRRGMGDT